MAWNDDLFSVRSGGAIGKSWESRMIDAMGGASTIRKKYQKTDDGRLVMAHTRGPGTQPEFIILSKPVMVEVVTKYYMTSGAFELGPCFPGNPALTNNSVLFKSDEVAANEAGALTPIFYTPPPANGEDSKLYNKTRLTESLLTDNVAEMYRMIPSNFSGLARRLAQGMFGIGKTALGLGDVPMSFGYGNTTGLLKFGTAYWLVSLATNDLTLTVTAYPVTIQPAYAKLLEGQSGDAYAAREIMALAWATSNLSRGIVVGTFTVPEGVPIAHGWNFSLTTNRADIVIANSPGVNYDYKIWSHLSLVFSAGPDAPSVSFSVVEQVEGWMLDARSPIWVPAGTATVWLNQYHNHPLPTSSQNCPVYCFYEADTLRVVRWTYTGATKAYNATERDAALAASRWANSFFGEGTCTSDFRYEYGTLEDFGFSCEGVSASAHRADTISYTKSTLTTTYDTTPVAPAPTEPFTPTPYGHYYAQGYVLMPNGYALTSLAPRGAQVPNPNTVGVGYHSYIIRRTYASGTLTTDSSYDATSVSVTPLVIPANDCCTVYLGSYTQEVGLNTHAVVYGNYVARVDEWSKSGSTVTPWIAPLLRQIFIATAGTTSGFNHAVESPPNESSSATYTDSKYTIKVITKGRVETLWSADSEIFHASFDNGQVLSRQVAATTSSLFPGAKYTNGNLTSDTYATDGNYPDSIDVFIGAS